MPSLKPDEISFYDKTLSKIIGYSYGYNATWKSAGKS